MKHTILCVDDEVDNVDALERLLRSKYLVLKATSGQDALKLLDQNRVTLIVSDQRMPKMTGVEFLAKSLNSHPDAIRILLTGYADIEVVIEAINSGQIYRYVNKPWDPVDLVNTIDKAIERYEIGQELRQKNKALQAALDELQTLDQAKNQFMVLVNHELKTPLTTMLSFTDLLVETKLDLDQQRFVNRIKAAALRLQDMINDSLELVSAETEQTKIELRSVSSKSVINVSLITENIQKILNDRHVNLNFEVENQSFIADEKILRNILRRLIHNAAKFARSQSVVEIKARSSENGRFCVSLQNEIADNIKIEDSKIKSLLKPFTLNENTLNHSVGTGLGLSICNALLKLHHSSLEFEALSSSVKVSFFLNQCK
jgi:two-component system sensor histidine kinase/response regulator